MTGSHTPRSLKYPVALLAAGMLLVTLLAPPAEAATRKKVRERRDRIERRARTQIGAGYRYGGSSPSGFDCSGFTRWVFSKWGVQLPHGSQSQFDMGRSKAHKRVWKRKNLKTGDLVFHKTDGSQIGHAGIYVGGGKFISATSSAGVRVRSLYDSYWGPRWVGATRHGFTRTG